MFARKSAMGISSETSSANVNVSGEVSLEVSVCEALLKEAEPMGDPFPL